MNGEDRLELEEGGVEIDVETVKSRALLGVASLVSRSFVVQAVAFASNFLLTIFLDPSVFGVFFLVSASINIFRYFSDVGLAAALIQKKEKVTETDLRTTFTVQQLLVGILTILIFILAPVLSRVYGFDKPDLYLLYALAISFFLTSLKTIPSILLERSLKFNLLIIPQLLEIVVYNLVAVLLAWRGFGVNSFTFAVLAQAIVGLVAIYIVSPWRIGYSFSRDSFKHLLKFGIPYQANTFIAAAKDDLMTIVLGRIVGTTGLGYLGWAKKWAEQPLRILMDNVSKVAFPAFSRLQEDKERLKKSLEKSLFFLCFLTFPTLMGFSILASDLVLLIPRYLKWQPALVPLYFYCFNSAMATVSSSMTNLLNAIGKIKTTFKLMIMWLVLTWLLMPIAAMRYNYIGVAVAAAIISLSSIVAVVVAKKYVNFDLLSTVIKPFFCTLIMGVVVSLFKFNFLSLLPSIILRMLLGTFVYIIVSRLITGVTMLDDIKRVYYEIRKKT